MAITTIQTFAEYTNISPSSFMPIVDINENTNSKNKKISIADLRKYFYTNQNLSRSFASHTPGLYYFGDNSDGPGNFSGSITALRTRITSSFSSSLDGPPVIKNFSSLFVSRSVVISPPQRCRGMLIFVDGDATISGSITMTARGAKFTGSDASFTVVNPPYLGDYWSTLQFPSSSYLNRVFAIGASGGATPSAAGSTGVGGRSGGGGSGGAANSTGGLGAAGTSFSGGSGGGGGGPSAGAAGTAYAFGGAGGAGSPTTGGGGAGNPGASATPLGQAGGTGTGGLLILIVRGNLKIGPNGSIITNGSNGGNGGLTSGGGGGSGGGVLYIYYGGTLTNNGTVTANGGSGGSGPSNVGGSGGAGTLTLSRLNVAFPVGN